MSSGSAALLGGNQDDEGGRPPSSAQLPTQMQLVGAFVEALRVRQHLPRDPKCALDDPTSSRGFTGATEVTAHWCCRLTTLCQALVEDGLVPLRGGARIAGAPHLGLFYVLAPEIAVWSYVRRVATHVTPLAFARYGAVAASLRVAALLRAVDEAVPENSLVSQVELLGEDPAWAEPKRVGEGLRRVIEATAGTQRSFAAAVGCSQDALSKWMGGRSHPRFALFEDIEAALVEEYARPPAEAHAVVVRLRWAFALAKLAKRLRGQLGRDNAHELATVFARLTRCHHKTFRACGVLEEPAEALGMSARLLSRHGGAIDDLLGHAARHGASEGFVDDVAVAHTGWRSVVAKLLEQLGVEGDDATEYQLLALLPRAKGSSRSALRGAASPVS